MRVRTRLVKIIAGVSIAILLATLAAAVLAAQGPSKPGDIFFPIQNTLEQWRRNLFKDETNRAAYMLWLLEKRITDLQEVTGSYAEIDAVAYLNAALERAWNALESLPTQAGDPLHAWMLGLTRRAGEALSLLSIAPKEDPQAYSTCLAQVLNLRHLLADPTIAQADLAQLLKDSPVTRIETAAGNSAALSSLVFAGAEPLHASYPLTGKHAQISCEDCHISQDFTATPNQCFDCHERDRPADHYTERCSTCHIAESWIQLSFNHLTAVAIDCIKCHAVDKPLIHHAGQCSDCHFVSDWTLINFNHAGITECDTCHMDDSFEGHYRQLCSMCHIPAAWYLAEFPHERLGATECQNCHAEARPQDHFDGNCSLCHTYAGWSEVNINHSTWVDCLTCHAGSAPAGHYPGQCSRCHTPASWSEARFNHIGYTDCKACHAGIAPAGHFDGQCSECHKPNFLVGCILQPRRLHRLPGVPCR
jgi:hypothetical protein